MSRRVRPRHEGALKAAVLAALALGLTACATARLEADRAWDRGDWASAVERYEAALPEAEPRHAERMLLRIGLACAVPASPVHDPARAQARLAELVTRFPSGGYRPVADVVLHLLAALEDAERQLATLREERADVEGRLSAVETDLEVKRTALAHLRVRLDEAEAELARLRDTLDQLKRIDLQRRR